MRCAILVETVSMILACLSNGFAAKADVPPIQIPFSVEWEEVAQAAALPALQSLAIAVVDGSWLALSGRTTGMHGFASGSNNFPRSGFNKFVYLIDPKVPRVVGHFDLTRLGPELGDPLTSTNVQSIQDGNDFFVIGGYGLDSVQRKMVTFDTVVRVRADALAKTLRDGTGDPEKIRAFFAIGHDPRLQVTGGELKKLGDQFLLVFGQTFNGEYSVSLAEYNRLGGMQQKYTEKVRAFTLNSTLAIQTFNQFDGGFDSSLPYNRRDFVVSDAIRPDGTPAVQVYGGVFKAGQVAGLLTPIEIDGPPIKVRWVKTFFQGLNHYDCAHIDLFDPSDKSQLTVLLGGISQFHYNAKKGALLRDQADLDRGIDGLPFIDTVSIIRRNAAGEYAQYVWPKPLPCLMGAEARFVPLSDAKPFANGVLNLANLSGRTLVGYVHGGIEATRPYSAQPGGSTKSSNRLFRIWITPGLTKVLPLPPIPTEVTQVP
jgi:hypothetical protein